MQTVLTIAGFDPSSGAGVTADLMVFAAHGLFGTACITALTVQSTMGVRAAHPVSAEVIQATLDCLNADLPPAGVKIGMFAISENIHVISRYIRNHHQMDEVREGARVFVLDPILRSSSGRELLDPAALAALRQELLPSVDWITPNLAELAILAEQPVVDRDDLPRACRTLQGQVGTGSNGRSLGVFATGGHLVSPDDFLLLPTGEEHWLPGVRIATTSTHGTGCALSSAFLSRLVLGDTAVEAAKGAKEYVARALKSAVPVGHGTGPLNLRHSEPA